MDTQRDGTGQFVETATLDDVLAVFDSVEGLPAVTSADVADATGLSPDSARRKLSTLTERGLVKQRKTAGRVKLYWRTDDERAFNNAVDDGLDGAGHRADHVDGDRQGHAAQTSDTTATETDATHGQDTPADDGEGKRSGNGPSAQASADGREMSRPERILRGLDLPGQGAKLDARVDTLLTLYGTLRSRQVPMSKGDLLALVDPDAVGFASDHSFWQNCVAPTPSRGRETNTLVALPGVEKCGESTFRYVDPERASGDPDTDTDGTGGSADGDDESESDDQLFPGQDAGVYDPVEDVRQILEGDDS